MLLSVGYFVPPPATTPPRADDRVDINLDSSWRFYRGDVANAQALSYNDSTWRSLNLPHTWNNLDGQDGGNNYYRGVAWYRQHFAIPASDSGKQMFLQFDGANTVTDVYVNGTWVGQHAGGYAIFRFDVTKYLRVGQENLFAVKVNNGFNPDVPPLYADYTFDGGLYRDVHLIVTDPVHVNALDSGSPGVFLTPMNVSASSAGLQIRTEVTNDSPSMEEAVVRAWVLAASGNVVTTLTTWPRVIASGLTTTYIQYAHLANPHLWDGRNDPYLYTVAVQVIDATGVHDCVLQPLGFRFYRIDPNQGFFLNGHPYDLHGTDMHQDWLNEGWATTPEQKAQDVSLVMEIGATAVRLSHYQYDQEIYNLFDQDGILVWTEIPNITYITNSAAFTTNVEQQLRELILQNYNHPSVFVWGIFNELQPSTTADPNPLLDKLVALAHSLDPTRLTTAATNQIFSNPLNSHTDVMGVNTYYGWYNGKFSDFGSYVDSIHKQYPNRAIGVSEYGAGASINQHTDNPQPPVIGPAWNAEGPYHPEEYQNLFHESYWEQIKQRPFLWCKFVWNLIDYASDERSDGDTPGRNDKGLVTYDRQTRKDAFYFYKANWSAAPVLYLTDRRFTQRTNAITQVKLYTNLGSATLYVNGKQIGTATANDEDVVLWKNVTLSPGDNLIQVMTRKEGVVYNDSSTWTLTPPTTTLVAPAPAPRLRTRREQQNSAFGR